MMNLSKIPSKTIFSAHITDLNLSEKSLKKANSLEDKIFDQFHCFSSLVKGEGLPRQTCEFSQKIKKLLERIHSSFGYLTIEGIVRDLCARLDEDISILDEARIIFKDWINDEFGLLLE